jgi:hypothetical protein
VETTSKIIADSRSNKTSALRSWARGMSKQKHSSEITGCEVTVCLNFTYRQMGILEVYKTGTIILQASRL